MLIEHGSMPKKWVDYSKFKPKVKKPPKIKIPPLPEEFKEMLSPGV